MSFYSDFGTTSLGNAFFNAPEEADAGASLAIE